MLQGRLFAYGDTHRYRLGTNNLQLPVNRPYHRSDFMRDGYGTVDNQGGAPNYHPNSFGGPESDRRAKGLSPVLPIHGNATRHDNGDDDNFSQSRLLYRNVLKPVERTNLANNIVTDLRNASTFIQDRAIANFAKVDAELGENVRQGIQAQQRRHADI